MERLERGVVAVRASETTVYIGWRLLGTDPAAVTFNVYRATGSGAPVHLNKTPLGATTDFVDEAADASRPHTYTVRAVVNGAEQAASRPATLAANAPVQQFLTVPLDRPAGGSMDLPPGMPPANVTYNANDASVGDLDGDGEYEIVLKWDPSNARDTASAGVTGSVLIDAYTLDGRRLWRIDLGRNIRAGAHYTQFIV
jgi:rhamnogalacturonan endolyase